MKNLKTIFLAVLLTFTACNAVCAVPAEQLSKYDSRDYGLITPVADQGDTTLCWAYSAISAAEASILKSGLAKDNSIQLLSPRQVGYARNNRDPDPLGNTSAVSTGKDYRYTEGNSSYAPALFSQWCGPVAANEADNCDGWTSAKYKFTQSVALDGTNLKDDENARLEIKKAIVKYGAVTFSYNNAREVYYYNPSNESGTASYPHACTVIGWDDSISAENFVPSGASQNGGWLVKNSYNSLPYFYLSYDNSSSNIYMHFLLRIIMSLITIIFMTAIHLISD